MVPDDVCIIKAGISRYEFNDLVDSYDKNKKFNLTISSNYTGAPDSSVGPAVKRHGDVLVISNEISTASEGTGKYNITGYTWSSELSNWVAMDGNYYAENIYFGEEIKLRGDYTAVGNIERGSDRELSCKGKSLQAVFKDIFDKRVLPTKGNSPTTTISGRKYSSVEVGTYLSDATFTLTYNPGKYISSWANNKTANDGTTVSAYEISGVTVETTNTPYTFDLSTYKAPFYIENTFTLTAKSKYTDGDIPVDNWGENADGVRISAGSTTAVNC